MVGPQRTGTTWLHAILGSHPEVFLTDPKEIYFFSRLKDHSHPRFESAELDWYLAHFRDPFPRWIARQVRTLARLGRFYRPKVRGEATASYAAMDRDLLEEIAVLGPATKILMMVRHPVDRAWSHAKKDLARNRGRRAEDVGAAEWTAFFRDPYQLRCARYAENLANWRACFGPQQVFFGTFEQVEHEPDRLLQRVTDFLRVSSDPRLVDPALLRSVVNPTGKSEVPDEFRLVLEDLLKDEIEDWRRLVTASAPT
ncbi:MAG: sulfotransferase [Candidatus Binatia bacterium]